jgi:hypothetical protein
VTGGSTRYEHAGTVCMVSEGNSRIESVHVIINAPQELDARYVRHLRFTASGHYAD